jgi:hypothetical protein
MSYVWCVHAEHHSLCQREFVYDNVGTSCSYTPHTRQPLHIKFISCWLGVSHLCRADEGSPPPRRVCCVVGGVSRQRKRQQQHLGTHWVCDVIQVAHRLCNLLCADPSTQVFDFQCPQSPVRIASTCCVWRGTKAFWLVHQSGF